MEFYYGLIGLLSLAWILLCLPRRSRARDRIYLIVSFGVLAVVSAARYCVGFDYWYVYSPQYEQLLTTPGYTFSDTRFEPGFVLLEKVIAFFSKDYHMLFVVTGILIMALFCAYYWKNSANPFIAVFLFLTLSQFYCTMDFVRQSIAAGIVTLGMPLLKQRRKPVNYVIYLSLVLLATTFHKSALVMIPFLLVNLLPVQNLFVLSGFSVATAVLYFNTDKIMEFVTTYWYQSYQGQNVHFTATFTPQFTISALVCFLILLAGSKLITARDKGNYLYVNYAFFNFFFVLMGTRHSILDRLSMYFMFAIPVGISILLDELGKQSGGNSIFAKDAQKLYARKIGYIAAIVVIFGGSLSIHHYALYMDHHGVVPYDVIWRQPFYAQYKNTLKEVGNDQPEMISDPGDLDLEAPTELPEQDFPGE